MLTLEAVWKTAKLVALQSLALKTSWIPFSENRELSLTEMSSIQERSQAYSQEQPHDWIKVLPLSNATWSLSVIRLVCTAISSAEEEGNCFSTREYKRACTAQADFKFSLVVGQMYQHLYSGQPVQA